MGVTKKHDFGVTSKIIKYLLGRGGIQIVKGGYQLGEGRYIDWLLLWQ